MKRKIIALLMATVCATTFFAACDEQASSSDLSEVNCATHTDSDKDALCDACGKAIVVVKEEIPAEKEEKVDMVVNPIPTDAVASDYIVGTVEKEIMPATGWTQSAILKDLWDKEQKGEVSIAPQGAQPIDAQGALLAISYKTVKESEDESVPTKYTDNILVYDSVNDVEVYKWTSDEYEEGKTAKKSIADFDRVNKGGALVLTCKEAEVKEDKDTTDPDDTVTMLTDKTLVYSTYMGKVFDYVTAAYKEGSSYHDECHVETINGVFAKIVRTWKKDGNSYDEETAYTFYLPNGQEIVTLDEITEEPTVEMTANLAYITIEGKTYVYDMELTKLHEEDKNLLIKRPAFDVENDKYGYVFDDENMYVYDLTKWLDCVYDFTMPSYWKNANTFVLENGNILVQYERVLPAEAVSYDYLVGDTKYDLVYTIINVADGTQKNVEFGYKINEFMLGSDSDGAFTEKALNLVEVNPIEEQEINTNETLAFIVDNELNILYCFQPTLAGQSDEMELIANNRFLTTIGYAEGTEVEAIVNEKGELVAKLPSNAQIKEGYIKIGAKVYDFDMNEKLDTADYDYAYFGDEHVYLTKDFDAVEATDTTEAVEAYTEAYIYTIAMSAPKKIAGDATKVERPSYDEEWYQVAKTTIENEGEEDETTKTTYEVYNFNGELVGTFEFKVEVYTEATDETPARLMLESGMLYFIK